MKRIYVKEIARCLQEIDECLLTTQEDENEKGRYIADRVNLIRSILLTS